MNETGAGTQDNALVSLVLTPAIREAAKDAVEAKRAFDRRLEEQKQCGFRGEQENTYRDLHLCFDTLQGLHRADCLLHGLAMGDGGQRMGFWHEWRQVRENYMAPLRQHIEAQNRILETGGRAGREVRAKLEPNLQRLTEAIAGFDGDLATFHDLPNETTPAAFIESWNRLNGWLATGQEIKQTVNGALQEAIANAKTKKLRLEPFLQGVPDTNRHVRIGAVWGGELSWPLKKFAREIVTFCRKVEAMNSCIKQLSLSPACVREFTVYRAVWTDCDLICAGLPADTELDSQEDVDLKDQFESFAGALRNMLEIVRSAVTTMQPGASAHNTTGEATARSEQGRQRPVEAHLNNPPAAPATVETEPPATSGKKHEADEVAKAPVETTAPQPEPTTPNTTAEVSVPAQGSLPQPIEPDLSSPAAARCAEKAPVSPSPTSDHNYDEIHITKGLVVTVNGVLMERLRLRALLALAVFAPENNANRFQVSKEAVIKLIDGPHVCKDQIRFGWDNRFRYFKSTESPCKHFARDDETFSGIKFRREASIEEIKVFLATKWIKDPKVFTKTAVHA